MSENIISAVHLLLMQTIDGAAADKFIQHVTHGLGDIVALSDVASEQDQITWLCCYWLHQVANSGTRRVVGNEYKLVSCRTGAEFLMVFKNVIIPILEENPEIPNTALNVPPIRINEGSGWGCQINLCNAGGL